MSSCINTNSVEFRALKECSGLSDFQLKAAIRAYQKVHPDSWPRLDEMPLANSEENLRTKLKMRQDGATTIKDILESTNTNSPEEATIFINNLHRDLNTSILPIHEDAIVTIERRPSPYELVKNEARDLRHISSPVFIAQSLKTLAQNFGIQTVYKTTRELQQEGVLDQVPEGAMASAFILNGNIVVNLDVASVDAPVHELMHVLLGAVKFTQPKLYFDLVQSAQGLKTFSQRAALYPHRAQMDVCEEVFVEEYSKYLSGIANEFTQLNPEILYQLNYEVSRTLDTILNGDNSVRVLPAALRFGSTLRALGTMVNSKNMESRYQGYAESAYVARVLANVKSDLFKQHKLEEIC